MEDFDMAILDPGVPPVSPSGSGAAFKERIDMISSIVSGLKDDCNILILTGSYDEAEARAMLRMGISKYLSKSGVNLIELRNHIDSTESEQVVGPDDQAHSERFFGGLIEKEPDTRLGTLNLWVPKLRQGS